MGVPVAMDVIGRVGQADAEAADQALELGAERLGAFVQGRQADARGSGIAGELGHVATDLAALLHHHAAAHHHGIHAGAVLGQHELVGRIVDRDPVHLLEVQEDDVGLVARRNAADLVEAQRPGATDGGCVQHLLGAQPAGVVRPLHVRHHGGAVHGLVHVEIVGAVGRIGADAEIDAELHHAPGIGNARSQTHVARRIVGDRGAVIGQPTHVVVVEPDAVGDGEIRAEQAQPVDMGGQGLAVALEGRHRLHLRFPDMAVQHDAEFARQPGRAGDQGVTAMERDDGRDAQADLLAVMFPAVQRFPHHRQRAFVRRLVVSGDFAAQPVGHGFQKPGDGLVEGKVGQHGRHHGAHPGIDIGLADGADFLDRSGRIAERQVVGGRAALEQHLHGAEIGVEVFVLEVLVGHEAGRAHP